MIRTILCNDWEVVDILHNRTSTLYRPILDCDNYGEQVTKSTIDRNEYGEWVWCRPGGWQKKISECARCDDIVKVSEAWRVYAWKVAPEVQIEYRADGAVSDWLTCSPTSYLWQKTYLEILIEETSLELEAIDENDSWAQRKGCRWHPGLEMPSWFSRITLVVTADPVPMRVQDVLCKAENFGKKRPVFSALWDSSYGYLFPYARNPWVWAIEVEREEVKWGKCR